MKCLLTSLCVSIELTGNKGEVLETSSVSADDATTPIKEVDQSK